MFPTKLEDLRALLAENLTARASKEARVDEIITSVEARGATAEPNEAEAAEVQAAREAVKALDEARASLIAEIATTEARAAARADAEKLGRSIPSAAISTTAGHVQVRSDEKIYRPGENRSFFADLYAQEYRGRVGEKASAEASERLFRHEQQMATEYRDIGVGAAAGTIPPKYLLDKFSINLRAGRPFLNAVGSDSLPPDFVSTVIPRGTAGASAAVVAEGAGFSETDMAVSNDTPVVQLIGGQQDVSRTLFERGGYVVDQIIFPDIIAAAETSCNATALKGTNNTTSILGPINVSGIATIAYTDGTPTVPELWPKLAKAVGTVANTRFAPATCWFMTPLRWAWITSAVDSQNRPLFNFSTTIDKDNPYFAVGTATEYGQVVGSLMNLPVVTDASLPQTLTAGVGAAGTEDLILLMRLPDAVLWEDPIMRFTFEQTPASAPGQVRLAAGRFIFAHFGRYPTGIAVVSGTGLSAPVF